MSDDPILTLLLKGINDSKQRDAIIEAHVTLSAGGAKNLPGAIAIYQARLIQAVVEHTEKTTPSAAHDETLADLLKAIKQVHEMDIPQVVQAKEEVMAANRSTRRLRISYLLLWMLLAAVVGAGAGAGAGAYGAYYFVALTPQQEQWLAAGKQIRKPLTPDQVDWLNFQISLSQRNISVGWSDPSQGTFGIKVVGATPYSAANVVTNNGQNIGVEAHWPDTGGGQ